MSQTILIVRTAGEESYRNAVELALTIEQGGYKPKILPYWLDSEHNTTSPFWAASPLLHSEIADAPRLSDFAFCSTHGYRLNLPRLMSHSYGVGELRPDTLLPESPWAQHLRGVAHRFSQVLRDLAPVYVLVPNGAEVISAIIAEVCSRASVKFLYWESPFFQGHHFVDPYAPHFYRGESHIDKVWPSAFAVQPAIQAAEAFIQRFVRERRSKYDQVSASSDLVRLENWIAADRRPIVFIPQQVPTDANVIVNLGKYDDYEAALQAAIHSVPSGWRILTKQHPKGALRRPLQLREQDSFDVGGIAIHDILERVSVVATMSSNVGLEALLYDLPVAVWGRPVYSGKGCTTELGDPSDLGAYLSVCLPVLDRRKRNVLIAHVLETSLMRHGDGDRLRALLDLATSASRSFADAYPERIQHIASAANALEAELKVESSLTSALAKLNATDRELMVAAAGPSLFSHTFGGAICAPPSDIVRLNYRSLFPLLAARNLTIYKENIQNHHAPDQVLQHLCRQCSAFKFVLLELEVSPNKNGTVQSLGVDDVVSIVRAIDPRILVEFWGRRGRRLTRELAGSSTIVMVLRRRLGILEPILSPFVSCRWRSELRYEPALLDAALFSSDCERLPSSAQILIAGPIDEGHVVYGPYRRLPAGKWRAQMLLAPRGKVTETEWTLDAIVDGDKAGALRWTHRGEEQAPVFEFECKAAGEMELRIWCHRLGDDEAFLFRGAELSDRSGLAAAVQG